MIITLVLKILVALFLDVYTPTFQHNVLLQISVRKLLAMKKKDVYSLIYQNAAMMKINVTYLIVIPTSVVHISPLSAMTMMPVL